MTVAPRGMSVQEAYREYREGKFRVNRRYQRKLVWTTAEKESLIDSILRQYPIPLILLGYETSPEGVRTFEILDGMQRLNAIFSFIENAFAWKGQFFDVDQLSRARQLADEGIFEPASEESDVLSPSRCADLLDYTLAVTEFPATDEKSVNDVFGRINSSGRQLSDQEKRQAGVLTPFSTLVRELAAEIRGDVSKDYLDLADMPEISVDVAGEAPEHTIKAGDTFWCRQGVLRRKQLRDSEDEQMLADLALTILQKEPFAFSGAALDRVYDPDTEESKTANSMLATYGATELKHHIRGTLSILRNTIEQVDPGPSALQKIVHPTSGSNPIKTAFYAVFNAFFELCIREQKAPSDAASVMDRLSKLQSKLHVSAGQIRSAPRADNIRVTKGLIQDVFELRDPPELDHGAGASIDFELMLRRSRVETAAFECKQGFLSLSAPRALEKKLVSKIIQTMSGIANIGPKSEGAILIGVADNERDMARVRKLDDIPLIQVGGRFVVGIDREAQVLGEDLDEFIRRFVDQVSASGLSPALRSDVLANIDCVAYRGVSVLIVRIPSQKEVSSVDDVVYCREGSKTRKLQGFADVKAVIGRFSPAE